MTPMAPLYITCPRTKKPILAGAEFPVGAGPIPPGTLARRSVYCDHCQAMHTWDGEDAYFRDDPPKLQPGLNQP